MQELSAKVIAKAHTLGIAELKQVKTLNVLEGSYINLMCLLPNGQTSKILDDTKKYLGTQIEIEGSERCYGIAADESQIAVYEYGCNGTEAILILWARL